MKFTWDERKARRNEREHRTSFNVAQAALESRLGIDIEEQFREGEWRTIILAPFRGILLLHITIAFYERGNDETGSTRNQQEDRQAWSSDDAEIRIISARKATAHERAFYFAAHPQSLG